MREGRLWAAGALVMAGFLSLWPGRQAGADPVIGSLRAE
jgi:hypothetical protein